MLRLIRQIYEKKKWMPDLQSGTANPTVDGKLVLKIGKTRKADHGSARCVSVPASSAARLYPVREAALVGGENVSYQTRRSRRGQVSRDRADRHADHRREYVAVGDTGTSRFRPRRVQSRLSRYVRGIGTLYDVNIKKVGYSRRPIELEIIGSNGVKTSKAARSARPCG